MDTIQYNTFHYSILLPSDIRPVIRHTTCMNYNMYRAVPLPYIEQEVLYCAVLCCAAYLSSVMTSLNEYDLFSSRYRSSSGNILSIWNECVILHHHWNWKSNGCRG